MPGCAIICGRWRGMMMFCSDNKEHLATAEIGRTHLIASIHIPKTAGTSFRFLLQAMFGARALFDYGDLVGYDTPETVARRALRTAEMRARRDELLRDYDIIHGHFIADKYAGLFPGVRFAAFFRDPYQQAVSNYRYLLRHPEIDHPGVKAFHEARISLLEFIEVVTDVQSRFLGQMAVEDLAMVGLTEQYERSIALFAAVSGRRLPLEAVRENVNADRQGEAYPIDAAVRKAIDSHRAADVELYRRACERFAWLAARYGV